MSGKNQTALISGVIVLLDAVAAGFALTADDTRVYVFGHAIPWECSMRRAGLPCPTCGMTRSLVMTLHGQFGRAWHMAPGGPVLLAGALLAAAVLLVSAARGAALPRWIKTGGVVYAAAAVLIWLGGWAGQFSRALQAR
jgi:Protein of unknown function (DUF2752)